MVGFIVDPKGTPQDVRALRGDGGALSDAAVKAVATWQFRPATAGGDAVEEHAEVSLPCGPEPPPSTEPTLPVGGAVSPPSIQFNIEPEYTEEARLARQQGNCVLALHITTAGEVTDIRVLRPLGKGLDERAMAAVKRWRFMPGQRDGNPVQILANIQVNFKLL